jgi:hypothetical protein
MMKVYYTEMKKIRIVLYDICCVRRIDILYVVQIRNNLMQAGGFSTITVPALEAYDDESIVTRIMKKYVTRV